MCVKLDIYLLCLFSGFSVLKYIFIFSWILPSCTLKYVSLLILQFGETLTRTTHNRVNLYIRTLSMPNSDALMKVWRDPLESHSKLSSGHMAMWGSTSCIFCGYFGLYNGQKWRSQQTCISPQSQPLSLTSVPPNRLSPIPFPAFTYDSLLSQSFYFCTTCEKQRAVVLTLNTDEQDTGGPRSRT